MAERAEAARKRRQRQAIIGSALAVIVIAGVAFWAVTALGSDDDDKDPATSAAAAPAGTVACTWTPEDGAGGGQVKDVGTPGPNAPNTGKDTMTVSTSLGDIVATVDKSKAPCTAA